jgi:hypothetical protein
LLLFRGQSLANIYTSHNRQESAQPASNFEALSTA